MLTPPQTSTPFPYTTLFRSLDAADQRTDVEDAGGFDPGHRNREGHDDRPAHALREMAGHRRPAATGLSAVASAKAERSEEHTSELQSLRHLVCRLLLEKKKR